MEAPKADAMTARVDRGCRFGPCSATPIKTKPLGRLRRDASGPWKGPGRAKDGAAGVFFFNPFGLETEPELVEVFLRC
jgi:hypothetical protein